MPEGLIYPELETKEKLDVLVVDGGMRGEALKWKFEQSARAGTIETTGFDIRRPLSEKHRIGQLAAELQVDFVQVSQENALHAGTVDLLRERGVPVGGPTRHQALPESSKVRMKEIAEEYGLLTASYRAFENTDDGRKQAHAMIDELGEKGVIKDNFLAEGKGVAVFSSNDEGHTLLDKMFAREFNNLGECIIVEHYSEGRERSGHISISNGVYDIWTPAEDHKQLLDGDRGPMTGGNGVITPLDWLDKKVAARQDEAVAKALIGSYPDLRAISFPGYKGRDCLEFNMRSGSTETETHVRRMLSDFLEHAIAIANGTLDKHKLQWSSDYAISVVGSAHGYPDSDAIKRGEPITGLEAARGIQEIEIFLGSVALQDGAVYSNGGRLFAVTATGKTADQARNRALEAMEHIRVGGRPPVFRTDIGKRAA